MTTQFEELKLSVTLVDQASTQLGKIQEAIDKVGGSGGNIGRRLNEHADGISRITKTVEDALKRLGGAEFGGGMQTIIKHAREMGSVFKPLGEGIEAASSKLLPMVGRVGGVATAVLLVGTAIKETVARVQEFSESVAKLHASSARIGVDPAQYQSMVETMRAWGLSMEQAQANIEGLAH